MLKLEPNNQQAKKQVLEIKNKLHIPPPSSQSQSNPEVTKEVKEVEQVKTDKVEQIKPLQNQPVVNDHKKNNPAPLNHSKKEIQQEHVKKDAQVKKGEQVKNRVNASRTLAGINNLKPNLPTTSPTSLYEFQRAWRNIHTFQEKADYLQV